MHTPLLEVRAERDGRRVSVRVAGEVDLATAPQVAACLGEHVASGAELIELDLSAVTFIDSTGVRLLLTFVADASRDGRMRTIVPSEPVRRIVCLLGLEQRLLAVGSSPGEARVEQAA
jgi:anti-anti-sigma factor